MSQQEGPGIDPQTAWRGEGAPFNTESFQQMRVLEAWRKYDGRLSWGRGQCLAILDDGCDLSLPAWQVVMPWGRKVIATWNSIDGNDDCRPIPPGYHGSTVGYPSSYNLDGVHGVAWANHVAHIRGVTVVHLRQDESASMARGLAWVRAEHRRLNITAVNLSPVDDQQRSAPLSTVIDAELRSLRELGVWVSAPAGNHGYTEGISWPACQPDCVAVGATVPGERRVWKDRGANIDLVVPAMATSSSNAYAAAGFQVLREAIELAGYNWRQEADNLPEAALRLMQRTGRPVFDPGTGLTFHELDLRAALDYVQGCF